MQTNNEIVSRYYKVSATEDIHENIMSMNNIKSNNNAHIICDEDGGDIDSIRNLYTSCIHDEATDIFEDGTDAQIDENVEFINKTLSNLEPIFHDRWQCHTIKNNKDIDEEKSEVWSLTLDLINREDIERDQKVKIRLGNITKDIGKIFNSDDGLSIILE